MGGTCGTHGKKEKCMWGLFQKPEGKVLFRIPGHGWMDNIKCIFCKCSGRNGLNLLAQDRYQ